jgi:hypothetical protein
MSTIYQDNRCRGVRPRWWSCDLPLWREHAPMALRLVVELDEHDEDEEAEDTDPLEEEFRLLVDKWVEETAHLSSPNKQALHPSYQRIIGLGAPALPLILSELQRKARFWFWALTAITGEQPVRETDFGNVRAMRDTWLQWGRERGYLL